MSIVLASIMGAALVLYTLLAGADYGAGLWDLVASGPGKEEQKELIANAIQPIWEANHVWLILLLVLLFAGYPSAFAAVMTALAVPILLMLAGIVLRGASFVFRAYSTIDSAMRRACGYVFSISSCFTPFFGGIMLGAISDNSVHVSHGASTNGYLFNWVNVFTFSCGLLTLAVSGFLAAAYLTVEASTDELREAFRLRALVGAAVVVVLSLVIFGLSTVYAPELMHGLLYRRIAQLGEIAASVAAITVCLALMRKRVRLARFTAAALAASVVISWAAAQYPFLVRPDRTIYNSVSSEAVVRDIIFASLAGALILFPSLALLFFIFKEQRHASSLSTPIQ